LDNIKTLDETAVSKCIAGRHIRRGSETCRGGIGVKWGEN